MPKHSLKDAGTIEVRNGKKYYKGYQLDENNSFKDNRGYTKKLVWSGIPYRSDYYSPAVQDVDKNGKPNKHGYIGGTQQEVRDKYWEQNPIIKHATDSIADAYGISGELLRHRLDQEGFTDASIHRNNGTSPDIWDYKGEPEDAHSYDYLSTAGYDGVGFAEFGLDDGADYIKSGFVKPIRERWLQSVNMNEQDRPVNTSDGETMVDNIGLTAAHLKAFRDKAAKDFPGTSRIFLDEAVDTYYKYGPYGGKNIMKRKYKKK